MTTDGTSPRTAGDRGGRPEEPESLAQLRGDCARMSSRWRLREAAAPAAPAAPDGRPDPAAAATRPGGVHVPERSARLLDGMSDYGD